VGSSVKLWRDRTGHAQMKSSAYEWVEAELRLRFDLRAMLEDQVRAARALLFEEWVEANQQRLLTEAQERDALDRPDGKVYFARNSATEAVKIGTSESFRNRVRALGGSDEVVVLAVAPGSYRVEAWMHRRFDHARISGEWFYPVPELMQYIERLKDRRT
jgi:hypothetical protein